MLRVLVDADNVARPRLQPLLDALSEVADDVQLTASGRPRTLARLDWPESAQLLATAGWQRADLAIAAAYTPSADPLILVSGDGDFGLLANRHPGPVLVISGAPSSRLRDGTTVIDPAMEGGQAILRWLAASGVRLAQREAGRRPPM